MDLIIENEFIEKIAAKLSRSPIQLNALQESDAELISIPGTDIAIALTTDSLVEEIDSGLYDDPYLIGWMCVIVNLSDLSAVGAEAVGILLNETLPPDIDQEVLGKIQQGIQDACTEHGIHVLGGDVNFSPNMQMSASAMGVIRDIRPLTRIGCRAGDQLFSSGKLGQGSSYALLKLNEGIDDQSPEVSYKPRARLTEGMMLRNYASACMDTSDGFFATLDQLMRLNKTGFSAELELREFIHDDTLSVSESSGIPPWMMLAGPHGEFELLFTIPPDKIEDFQRDTKAIAWDPIMLGQITQNQEILLMDGNRHIPVDTARIRNMFNEVNGNVEEYIAQLFKIKWL
jgi:thiamine-monophosphate kinase